MTRKVIPQGLRWMAQASRNYSASAMPSSRQVFIPSHTLLSGIHATIPRSISIIQTCKFVRSFSTTLIKSHGHIEPPKPGEELWVTYVDKDGTEVKVPAKEGDNLLDLAQANDLDLEGACGGSCACSTCHLIVRDHEYYDKLPPEDDDEGDMLDLAFGLTDTSRLGCQIKMTKEIDGIVVKLPQATRNLQKRDFE